MEPVLLDHNSKKIRKKETGQRTNCKILSLESKKRKGGERMSASLCAWGNARSRDCTACGKSTLWLSSTLRVFTGKLLCLPGNRRFSQSQLTIGVTWPGLAKWRRGWRCGWLALGSEGFHLELSRSWRCRTPRGETRVGARPSSPETCPHRRRKRRRAIPTPRPATWAPAPQPAATRKAPGNGWSSGLRVLGPELVRGRGAGLLAAVPASRWALCSVEDVCGAPEPCPSVPPSYLWRGLRSIFFKKRFTFYYFWLCVPMCLCMFVHVGAVPIETGRRRWIPGTRVSSGCEPLCGCLELNSCPLQEQKMYPSSEVPLHLQTSAYLQGKRHYTCRKATILNYGDVFLLWK